MIAYFQSVAKALGMVKGVTGHVCRVSGARRMARAGVDLWHIQLFARWQSKIIMRYVREAPLATSHLLASRMAAGKQIDVDPAAAQKDDGVQQEPDVVITTEPEKTVKEIEKITTMSTAMFELPQYVLNSRNTHHSRAKLHRPRDHRASFCDWEWADALERGLAISLENMQSQKCKICQRLHLSAGIS